MTTRELSATLWLMVIKGKPGRRQGTPFEYQEAVKMRLRDGREARHISLPQMAAELSAVMGRAITPDTYRKWEQQSLPPHDALLPICDLIQVHILRFLGDVTDEERQALKKSFGKKMPFQRAAPTVS
jgi:transcriptional regulator with XRE-family HTH domain